MTLTQRIGKALTTRSSLIRRCLMCGRAARLVTKPLSLLWTELGPGHSSLHRWILRANGRAVWLRSRTSDLQVFVEIFCRGLYRVPDAARKIIETRPTVIDAGANIGLFSVFIADELPTTRIIAYEPDPDNAAVAVRNLSGLIATGRVEFHEAAVGASNDTISFASGLGMNSHVLGRSAGGTGARVVQQIDLLPQMREVGLLKLDVEGAEWEILRDQRLSTSTPRCLVMEWHALHHDVQESQPQAQLMQLLQNSGFTVVSDPPNDVNLVGGLWAWRPTTNVGIPEAAHLKADSVPG